MINKIFKLINNKNLRYIKFIFFLRYLLLILCISAVAFLLTPKFFNYDNKSEFIKKYLEDNYSIRVNSLENINYNIFPIPHLTINELNSNFTSEDLQLKIGKIYMYLKLSSIYNFNDLNLNRIKLEDNELDLKPSQFKEFIIQISRLKNKIYFKDLNIDFIHDNKNIISLKRVNFFNYGYKKNLVKGELFNKKFKIKFHKKPKIFDFKLVNTGISMELDYLEQISPSKIKGNLKAKILNSKFKLKFLQDKNQFNIESFLFRNKDLSFDTTGNLIFIPFFTADLKTIINEINFDKIKIINLEKLLKSKDLIKKITIKNELSFNSKKFSKDIIDKLKLKTNLVYGRLSFSKEIFILDDKIKCFNKINLIEKFPVLFFNCTLETQNRKKIYKKLKIDIDQNTNPLNLNVNGRLNIFMKKVYFESIKANKTFEASNEDLKYFKENFEQIILNESYMGIFDLNKFRKFIIQIS